MTELLVYLNNLRAEIQQAQKDHLMAADKLLELQSRQLEMFEMFLKAYLLTKNND